MWRRMHGMRAPARRRIDAAAVNESARPVAQKPATANEPGGRAGVHYGADKRTQRPAAALTCVKDGCGQATHDELH